MTLSRPCSMNRGQNRDVWLRSRHWEDDHLVVAFVKSIGPNSWAGVTHRGSAHQAISHLDQPNGQDGGTAEDTPSWMTILVTSIGNLSERRVFRVFRCEPRTITPA